jgi:anti-sigma B factor antagonist
VSTTADIAVEQVDGWSVARLRGELDMTNCDHVRDELTGSIPNDAHGLVADLSDTAYLDSAAIELLFEMARRLGRRRQELRIVLPAESPLKRVLELTDVRAVAPIHPSLATAIAGGSGDARLALDETG